MIKEKGTMRLGSQSGDDERETHPSDFWIHRSDSQLNRFGDPDPATYMYGNPLVPTILAQHAMCKVRGLVRANITQPKSIALLIDDAEQCKEFCGRHQDCKLDHMASSQCSTGMFQETCGHEPIQIFILRPNSANEHAKKHCDALEASRGY